MIKVLAISHAYTELFSRAGLLDTLQCPDIELTVVVPKCQAEKHVAGYLKLCEEQKKTVTLGSILNFHHSVRAYGPELIRLMNELRPDVILVNDEPWSTTAFQVAVIKELLRLRSKLVVYTCENQVRKYPIPFRWFERYVLRRTDMVFTLPKHGGPEVLLGWKKFRGRIEYLPLTADTEKFRRLDSGDGIKREQFVLGFVGRLVPEKGVDLAIDALTRMARNVVLTIIGDGPERKRLEELSSRHGLGERVKFISDVQNHELPRYINMMNVLLLPSKGKKNWKEQFGRVLVEAMACEVPVIGSSSGEIPEVIGDAGLIFKEGDIEDLVSKIETLKNDETLRNKLSKAGRERVLMHYDTKVVMERTAALYREIVRNAGSR